MKYHKKRKTKCIHCKKMKTLACFGEVDMFWGRSKTCSWCKVCDRKLDKDREKVNRAQRKLWDKRREEFVKNGGILKRPIVGIRCEIINDKIVETFKGWYAEEGKDNRVINGKTYRKMEKVI